MTQECELMLQVQQGQLNKLAPLFEAYKVKLYNYFLHRGHSHGASEDLVQETFTKVLAYRHSFTGEGTFRSWLYGIARNTAVDHYRKHKNEDQHDEFDHMHAEIETDRNSNLNKEVEQAQRQALFEQSLKGIAIEDSEIILLSRVHQLKYEQIAELVGCNINTLKSKMQAALQRLQNKFNELNGDKSEGEK